MNHQAPLVNKQLFKEIIDVSIPETVSWMPQTIGWKIVGVVLLITVSYKIYQRAIVLWNNRYRKEGIAAINALDTATPFQCAQDLFFILKAVASYRDNRFSSLVGQPLLLALDELHPGKKTLFNNELGLRWQNQLLLPESHCTLRPNEIERLVATSKLWIAEHKFSSVSRGISHD